MLSQKLGNLMGKLIALIANVCILIYVVDMEKKNCECSDSWLRDYIKIVSSILITFAILSIVIPNLQELIVSAIMKNKILALPILVWNIVALVYMGVVLTYYYRLSEDPNCQCSVNWKRFMLLYPLVILVPLILLVVFGLLIKVVNKLK